jgi:hypothetical protein
MSKDLIDILLDEIRVAIAIDYMCLQNSSSGNKPISPENILALLKYMKCLSDYCIQLTHLNPIQIKNLHSSIFHECFVFLLLYFDILVSIEIVLN